MRGIQKVNLKDIMWIHHFIKELNNGLDCYVFIRIYVVGSVGIYSLCIFIYRCWRSCILDFIFCTFQRDSDTTKYIKMKSFIALYDLSYKTFYNGYFKSEGMESKGLNFDPHNYIAFQTKDEALEKLKKLVRSHPNAFANRIMITIRVYIL